jgi:tetratricopeptide (TPR) repeat protein
MRPASLLFHAAILLLLSSSFCLAAGSETYKDIFAQGNAHYRSGDFAAAERAYRTLVDGGIEDGAVYYNLGNACFKQKKLGEAIYFWEKARRRAPGDSDVTENLQFASLFLVDRLVVPQDPFPLRLLERAVHLFTFSGESNIVLGLFVTVNLLLGLSFLVRRPRFTFWMLTGICVAAFLLILFAGSLAWKIHQEKHFRQGVIVEQKVDIRSGPGTENVTVFTVHEGILVRVKGESNGWMQITLPNGWSGWLPGTSLRIL